MCHDLNSEARGVSVKGRTRLTGIWKGQLGAQLFAWGIAGSQGQKLKMSQNGHGHHRHRVPGPNVHQAAQIT